MRYESLRQCAEAEGISLAVLKEVRKYLPQCFNHNRVVNVEELKAYVSEHLDDLEAEANETLDALKKERLRLAINRESYQFSVVKSKYVDKDLTIQRITDIANAQKILLKAALLESLPAKLVGLSQTDILVELEKTYNAICKEMQGIKL